MAKSLPINSNLDDELADESLDERNGGKLCPDTSRCACPC
jgi:hypothetical protein